MHNWPAVFLRKENQPFPLELASSGEIQMFTTLAFIASHIDKRTAILIDEPENSLHPRWQAEFLDNLSDQFYQYEPKIVIATHAPIVVTQAANLGDGCCVYRMIKNKPKYIVCEEEGVEEILWDVFKMLTPRSAFLSRHLAKLLHQYEIGGVDTQKLMGEIGKLKIAARYDNKQRSLIEHAHSLALKDAKDRLQ
nr:AAA family ATPase [Pseudomonas rhizoryzae]